MAQNSAVNQHQRQWTNLFGLLEYRARNSPARGLYVREGRGAQQFRTFSQLLASSHRLAHALSERGVSAGDRVLIAQPTGFDFVTTFFGLQALGAIPVPLNWPQRRDPFRGVDALARWRRIAGRYDARVLVCGELGDRPERGFTGIWPPHPIEVVTDAKHLREHSPARVEVEPVRPHLEDIAYIQSTSGTSAPPRGVKLTHSGIHANVAAIGERIDVSDDDVIVSWLPLDNIMGLVGVVLFALHWGVRPVLMHPEDFLADPEDWFWAISEHRATLSLAPNFAFNYCVRRCNASKLEGLDLSSWRIAMNGSEPVRAQHIQAFARRFHDYGLGDHVIMPVYGLSEATLGVTFHPASEPIRIDGINRRQLECHGRARPLPSGGADTRRERMHVVSVGRPLEDIELRIVDDNGEPVGQRTLGEIAIRTPAVMKGYVDSTVPDEQHSPTRLDDGWLLTGDLGYMADGDLFFIGRASDRIELASGRTVFPEEVELFVDAVDGVRAGSTAVFAAVEDDDSPDLTEESGAENADGVVVVFEVQTGADAQELTAVIESVLQTHLGLDPVQTIDLPVRSVPKTPTGKVRRRRCRQFLQRGLVGDGLDWVEPALWAERFDAVAETLRGSAESVQTRLQRWLNRQ